MQIKDQATATEAALNLNSMGSESSRKEGEPAAPRSETTASKLFPEFVSDDGLIVNRPVKAYTDSSRELPPAAATPSQPTAPTAPVQNSPTAAGELDLSKMPDGTMVKIKVDGVEMTVPAKEALKSIQLERHLTLKSQELARDRAALEVERAALKSANQPPAVSKKDPELPIAATKGEDPRIEALQRKIDELNAIVAPQRLQAGLNILAKRAEQELGAKDFLEYAPKIQAFVNEQLAKPEVAANPNIVNQLDNSEFWYAKYQEMKLRDMLSENPKAPAVLNPSNVVSQPSIIKSEAGTHLVLDKNNNPVIVPMVEGSSGVPSRVSPDQDWQGRYQAAIQTATKSGKTEDWQKVFRLKREIPSN